MVNHPIPRTLRVFLWSLLAIVLFGQRVAINLAGTQIGVSFIVFYALLLVGVLNQQVLIQSNRLFWFFLAVIGLLFAALSTSNSSHYFSVQSFFLLLALYFLSVFVFQANLRDFVLNGFQTLAFVIAVIGVVQFASQFLGIPYRDWLAFIPATNIISNYNYTIPIEFNSNIFKANGVFLQEPSTFSQIIAISTLLELYIFKKYARLFVWIAALLVSFSGTGLILLVIGVVSLIFKLQLKTALIFAAVGGLAAAIFWASGFAFYTLNRVDEFDHTGKSGYIRFIAPYETYIHFIEEPTPVVYKIFGLGPGASDRHEWQTITHFTPLIKLAIEYGLFGFLFYGYLIYIFFARQPFWLAFTLFTMYTFLSGGLLTYQTTILFFLLLTLHQPVETTSQQDSALQPVTPS